MQYAVVRREEAHELVEAINSWIEDGWEPIGGIAYEPRCGGYGFSCVTQALIKRTKNEV